MFVTRETTQFERSLLNFDAVLNAVKIFNIRDTEDRRQEQNYKEKRKIEKIY